MEPHAEDNHSPAEVQPAITMASDAMAESGVWPKGQHGQKGKHVFKFKRDYIVLEKGNSA